MCFHKLCKGCGKRYHPVSNRGFYCDDCRHKIRVFFGKKFGKLTQERAIINKGKCSNNL